MQQKATTKNKQTYFSYNVIIFYTRKQNLEQRSGIFSFYYYYFFHQNGSAGSAGSRDC